MDHRETQQAITNYESGLQELQNKLVNLKKLANETEQKRKLIQQLQEDNNILQDCIEQYLEAHQEMKSLQNETINLTNRTTESTPTEIPCSDIKSNKIPKNIWLQCWSDKHKCFDFSQNLWTELSHTEHVKYAKNYRDWYANTYDKKLTITKYCNKDKEQQVPFIFKLIPPGVFWMGSPESEHKRESDEVRHKVWISEPFWIGETPVTQRQWQVLTGNNPSHFKNSPDNPVEYISWEDCNTVTEEIDFLQFPSEAQWEYACRAGSITAFNFGEDVTPDLINYDGNEPYYNNKGMYREKTTAVKKLKNQNAWGCYDFHGNVREWCIDYFSEYSIHNPIDIEQDPIGSDNGSNRVLRGGSWNNLAQYSRSAFRDWDGQANAFVDIGVRFVLNSNFKAK